jgi:hypothetical protein
MALRTNELKKTMSRQKNEQRATSPRPSPPKAERETEASGESVNQFCQAL